MSDLTGKVLDGRYKIEGLLGKGGMAEVYRGHDEVLDRPVAVKILTERSESVTEALLREARSMARLNHPGIVAVYDAGHDLRLPYIVMELVSGRTLDDVPGSEITLRGAVTWFVELLDALAYAHESGVVHRDIKPANVMVLGDRHVKVMDFGLSKRASDLSNSTAAGEIVGTISYLAPERFLGRPADERSDLYSVGCVMYEIFTGRVPFKADGDDVVAAIYAHVNDTPAPPRRVNPSVPAEIERIILKLLEKEPERRYASAREVENELRSLLTKPGSQAAAGAAGTKPPTQLVAAPPPHVQDPEMRKQIDAAFGRTQKVQDAAAAALAAMLAERKADWTEGARAYRQATEGFKQAGNEAEWGKNAVKFATMILHKHKDSEKESGDRRELDDAVAVLQEALPVIRGRMIRSELEEAERLLYMLQRAGATLY